MAYDFTLSDLESSPKYQQAPFEERQAVVQDFLKENGPQEALDQLQQFTSTEKFAALPPEEQDSLKSEYMAYYGLPETTSFGTDAKDVALAGLAGTSSIPKAIATVAGWFGAEGSKETLLDIAKTTEDFYTSKISKQGQTVQKQPFLSDEDGQIFGDNAIKKVLMTSAQSLPLMIATAPAGGAISAGLTKAPFLPSFIRALEGGSKAGKWAHNMLAYGTTEAGSSALVSAADAGEKIADMPEAQLAKSPAYQELLATMSPKEAREELRDRVEQHTVMTQFAATLAGSAISPGGATAKLFEKGGQGILKTTVGSIAEEVPQEFAQSGLEQASENITTRKFLDPSQKINQGTLEAASLGAASAVATAGSMGFSKGALSISDAEQLAKDIPLNAEPDDIVKTIEQANGPIMTVGDPDLTEEQQADLSAFTQKAATMTFEQAQKARNSLPNVYRVSPQLGEQVNAIINGRIRELTTAQTVQEDPLTVIPRTDGRYQPVEIPGQAEDMARLDEIHRTSPKGSEIDLRVGGGYESQQASTQGVEGAGVAAVPDQQPAGMGQTVPAGENGDSAEVGRVSGQAPISPTAADMLAGDKLGRAGTTLPKVANEGVTEQPIPATTPITEIKAAHGRQVGNAVAQARANKESISLPEAYRRAGVEYKGEHNGENQGVGKSNDRAAVLGREGGVLEPPTNIVERRPDTKQAPSVPGISSEATGRNEAVRQQAAPTESAVKNTATPQAEEASPAKPTTTQPGEPRLDANQIDAKQVVPQKVEEMSRKISEVASNPASFVNRRKFGAAGGPDVEDLSKAGTESAAQIALDKHGQLRRAQPALVVALENFANSIGDGSAQSIGKEQGLDNKQAGELLRVSGLQASREISDEIQQHIFAGNVEAADKLRFENSIIYDAKEDGDRYPKYMLGGIAKKLLKDFAETKQEIIKARKSPTPSAVPAESRQPAEKTEPTYGSTGTAETETGREIEYQWAIVEAADLIASNDHETLQANPNYPAELQPRKRENAAYRLQVEKMANSLKPARLGLSQMVSDGAPIVGPDMAVESGNGRTISIKKAYASGKAEAYKGWIAGRAGQFGLTEDQVSGIKSPVLVRVRKTEMTAKERVTFASEANESAVTKMSDIEQAAVDANKLESMADFNPTESGEFDTAANRPFIKRFISSVVAASDQNDMYVADGSGLSQSGRTRIRNAVFVKAYGANEKVLSLVVESTDNNVRNITNGMLLAAPKIAKMKSDIAAGKLHDIDISEAFARVVEDYAKIVAAKKTVEYELSQLNILGESRAENHKSMLLFLEENKRSGKKIALFLTQLANTVYDAGDPTQLSMFGGAIKPTTEKVIAKSIAAVREASDGKQGRLFGEVGQDGGRPADIQDGQKRNGSGEEGRTVAAEEPPSGISRGTVKEGGVKYETTVNRLVDVRERKGRKIQGPTQMSLFAAPTVQPKEQRAAKRRLFAEVKHSSAGSFTFDGKADNFATIAQIAAPIMSQAQENNIIVMTDENDIPVVVLRHAVGATHMAPVQAPFILGVAHSIPSVKNIWFAHNHPSGGVGLSAQDVGVSHMLGELAKDTGITVRGIIAVTPQGKYYGQGISGNDTGDVKAGGKSKVSGISRTIVKLSDQEAIVGASSLEKWVKENAPGETGVLLLDNSHRPNAFVPMTTTEMQTVRTGEKGKGASGIFDAIDKTNSIAAVIVTNASVKTSDLRNIVKFIDANQLRILDTIQGGKADNRFVVEDILGQGFKTGKTQPNAFFSTSLPPNQQADTPTELRAKLGRGYDALIRSGKVRLVETQREAERIISGYGKSIPVETAPNGGDTNSRNSGNFGRRGIEPSEPSNKNIGPASPSLGSDSTTLKEMPNSPFRDIEGLRDLTMESAITPELYDSLGIGGKRAVKRSVVVWAKNFKVLDSVVSLIPVNMVDTLALGEFTPDVLLNNKPVRRSSSPFDLDNHVPLITDASGSLSDSITSPRAVINNALVESGAMTEESFSTNGTRDRLPVSSGRRKTSFRAEMLGASGEPRRKSRENFATSGATTNDLHIITSNNVVNGQGVFAPTSTPISNIIQGFTVNINGKPTVYLVNENIAKGKSFDVLVHEIAHATRLNLADSPTFKRILANIEARKDEKSPEGDLIRAAIAAVPKDTKPEHIAEEILAYAVEKAPETGIVRRFIALVKQILVKMGINPRIFSVADLRALAEVAVRREALAALREEATDKESLSVGQFAQDVLMSVKDAARKIQGMEAFKAWFGGSVMKSNGDPMVFYHGTKEIFGEFKAVYKDGLLFFTHNPEFASRWANNRQKKNPRNFLWTDQDEQESRKFWGEFGEKFGNAENVTEEQNEMFARRPKGKYELKDTDDAAVMPVFLKVERPFVPHEHFQIVADLVDKSVHEEAKNGAWLPYENERVVKRIKDNGFDGILLKEGEYNIKPESLMDYSTVAVFESQQVKSLFNPGQWSPTNPDIMMSVGIGASTPGPGRSTSQYITALADRHPKLKDRLERFVYSQLDSNDPRRRIMERAGTIGDDTDILTVEKLRGKVQAEEIKRYNETVIIPLLKHLGGSKLLPRDLEEYAYVKHVPERNSRMRQVNAKRFIDEIRGNLNTAETLAIDNEMIDIRSDILMAGGTRAERQNKYLAVLSGLLDTDMQSDLDAQQQALDDREFTDAEIAKGTPERLQARLDKRQESINRIQAIKTRWENESPRWAGITDEESFEILDRWEADPKFQKIERAREMLAAINQHRLDVLHEAGQLTDDEYQSLTDGYEFYVPLYRDIESARPATGRITGPTGKPLQVAKGSLKEVVNILAHSVENVQAAIVRKHKAKAGEILLNFANEFPDAGVTVTKQAKKPSHDKEGNIVMYPEMREGPDELYIRVKGERYTLTFANDPTTRRFLESIKEADSGLPGPLKAFSYFNRLLSMVNTVLSPEFIFTNFSRDIQTAGIHIETTEAKGLQIKIAKNIFPAIKGILKAEFGKDNSYWSQVYRDYGKHGAKIGWMQTYEDTQQLAEELESTLKLYQEGHLTRKAIVGLGKLITRTNTAVENGVRLAVYDQLVKIGVPKDKAALATSNLTVDFTTKGASSHWMNALFLFYNASVQGNVRIIKAVAGSGRVRAIVGGIVVAGFLARLLGYATGGDDETGQPYIDGLPEYIQERNMIFMRKNGEHYKIPMPYGYNVFFNVGGEMARAYHTITSGKKYNAGKGSMRVMNSLMGSFNPLNSATIAQTLSPTLLDPLTMVIENKAWNGSALMPAENPYGVDKVDSYRFWKSASKPSQWVAQKIHEITGGRGQYEPGKIEISPEHIDMMYETITGSAGRFAKDILSLPWNLKDDDVDINKIPIARRFYGKWSDRNITERYREQVEKIERFEKNFQTADKSVRMDMVKEPEYKMMALAKSTEKTLAKLRENRKKVEAAGKPTKLFDAKIKEYQSNFLRGQNGQAAER